MSIVIKYSSRLAIVFILMFCVCSCYKKIEYTGTESVTWINDQVEQGNLSRDEGDAIIADIIKPDSE